MTVPVSCPIATVCFMGCRGDARNPCLLCTHEKRATSVERS